MRRPDGEVRERFAGGNGATGPERLVEEIDGDTVDRLQEVDLDGVVLTPGRHPLLHVHRDGPYTVEDGERAGRVREALRERRKPRIAPEREGESNGGLRDGIGDGGHGLGGYGRTSQSKYALAVESTSGGSPVMPRVAAAAFRATHRSMRVSPSSRATRA